MSELNSTGTTRGSEHPAVRELIADTISVWFGSREPSPDDRETISSEALAGMLHRVADRSYNAGRADPEPAYPDDDAETTLCQINAIFSAIDAMAADHESQFEAESARWLVILGRDLVRRLQQAGGDES